MIGPSILAAVILGSPIQVLQVYPWDGFPPGVRYCSRTIVTTVTPLPEILWLGDFTLSEDSASCRSVVPVAELGGEEEVWIFASHGVCREGTPPGKAAGDLLEFDVDGRKFYCVETIATDAGGGIPRWTVSGEVMHVLMLWDPPIFADGFESGDLSAWSG